MRLQSFYEKVTTIENDVFIIEVIIIEKVITQIVSKEHLKCFTLVGYEVT